MIPNTTVTPEAISGKIGRRFSTICIAAMAATVPISSAQVPSSTLPVMPLTTNIAIRGPNSLAMLTVCSALNGKTFLTQLMRPLYARPCFRHLRGGGCCFESYRVLEGP